MLIVTKVFSTMPEPSLLKNKEIIICPHKIVIAPFTVQNEVIPERLPVGDATGRVIGNTWHSAAKCVVVSQQHTEEL
jgi:hypothetical protein